MKYNITQHRNIYAWIFSIFLSYPSVCFSQEPSLSKYGVLVVKSIETYHKTIANDSLKTMTNLQSLIPNIELDLRYATKNNFMGRRMYPKKTNYTFLRAPAAYALLLVQKDLNAMGFGLKIFDAYRPYSVTEKFWELVHDDRYVANPTKGSGHNRGIAIDLTIIDLKNNRELKMPTGFDNFTDSAHQDFMSLPENALKNRELLKTTMMKYGFLPFATEWWHFSLPNPEKYEVLDLSFRDLKEN